MLFDTSAESLLSAHTALRALPRSGPAVCAVTIIERMRGYALLWERASTERRPMIDAARAAYLRLPRPVIPIDAATAVVAAEIMAVLPVPPSPPRKSHRRAENRSERLARWRFDCIVAATALTHRLPLVHDNAADFEPIRGAVEQNPHRFPGLGPLELIRFDRLFPAKPSA